MFKNLAIRPFAKRCSVELAECHRLSKSQKLSLKTRFWFCKCVREHRRRRPMVPKKTLRFGLESAACASVIATIRLLFKF
jgi:hypothetical protein